MASVIQLANADNNVPPVSCLIRGEGEVNEAVRGTEAVPAICRERATPPRAL